MDITFLYVLILLVFITFFLFYLYNQYYVMANRIYIINTQPEIIEKEKEKITITEKTMESESKEKRERTQNEQETITGGRGGGGELTKDALANLLSPSSTPSSTLTQTPGTASMPITGGSAPRTAGFEDYIPNGTPAAAPVAVPITELDFAPTIKLVHAPEPPSISGLMNEGLGEFRNDLNYFFKTSDVSRQRKRGPALIQPPPEKLPEIKHLYGDGSYDDTDNVHVYKTK